MPALQRNQLVQLDDIVAAEACADLVFRVDLAIAMLGYSWLPSVGRLRISYSVVSRGKSDFSSAVASGCIVAAEAFADLVFRVDLAIALLGYS